jgi:hypothetical protein
LPAVRYLDEIETWPKSLRVTIRNRALIVVSKAVGVSIQRLKLVGWEPND